MRSITSCKDEGPRAKMKRSEPAITGTVRCLKMEHIVGLGK